MNLIRVIRERFLSWSCFINGAAYENPRGWQERTDMGRIEYAKSNPWVLNYNFGHKGLIERDAKRFPVV